MSAPRKIAAGNWKMNGTADALAEVEALLKEHAKPGCDMVLCPPATLLHRMAGIADKGALAVGGQDCHARSSGAHTGDISAAMLQDAGATHVITGHSERRTDHGETDEDVRAKTEAAHAAGLIAIVCIGETLEQRDAGTTLDIVAAQLGGSVPDGATAENTVIAYEPVWAIGTGRVPEIDQIAEVHDFLRARLESRFGEKGALMSLLYGGSVKPANAAEIFAVTNVNGALVGGASLKAADFGGIVAALGKS
ncbi:triose-phosphate isomerase [Oceaniglobus indicus]|uniref:triose-phosphate isomerase n=1 Tax=Oceaniglobus indicus TaxID=2047749 RepID=UPI000C17E0A0|nr:triose-phosphate isomerase [Oceaniglobus indicus]